MLLELLAIVVGPIILPLTVAAIATYIINRQ